MWEAAQISWRLLTEFLYSISIAAGLWRSLHYVVLGRASLLAACKTLGSSQTYIRSRDRANGRARLK